MQIPYQLLMDPVANGPVYAGSGDKRGEACRFAFARRMWCGLPSSGPETRIKVSRTFLRQTCCSTPRIHVICLPKTVSSSRDNDPGTSPHENPPRGGFCVLAPCPLV